MIHKIVKNQNKGRDQDQDKSKDIKKGSRKEYKK